MSRIDELYEEKVFTTALLRKVETSQGYEHDGRRQNLPLYKEVVARLKAINDEIKELEDIADPTKNTSRYRVAIGEL